MLMATQKQIDYLHALMQGRSSSELNRLGMTQRERRGDFSLTSMEKASELIDKLKRAKE
jgi:hypothetical protein